VKASISGKLDFVVGVCCADDAAAARLKSIARRVSGALKGQLAQGTPPGPAALGFSQAATASLTSRQWLALIETLQPKRKGKRLLVVREGPSGIAAIGIIARLLPAMFADHFAPAAPSR
jgi:hypothetical protein